MPEPTHAQRLTEQGYDVVERDGVTVIDIPNPRVTDDDYFHGPNPYAEGFGSRGVAAEGGAHGDLTVSQPGTSTADAQDASGGAGWNVQAGSGGEGAPDESWTNARLKEYADTHGVDLGGASNKGELLKAIRASE